MNKENVLITGGGGYIGSVLCQKLVSKGFHVEVLEKKGVGKENLRRYQFYNSVKFHEVDIREIKNEFFNLNHFDYVINLAAISDGIAGAKNPELTYEINYRALDQFIKFCKNNGVKRFIHASTASVYGMKYKVPLVESLNLLPEDPYSISKAKSEEIVQKYGSFDFTTTILRPSLVFGWSPKMRFDFIVNTLIYNAIKTGEIKIFGGEQIRPQTHVQDVADCFINMLSADKDDVNNQPFNVVAYNPSLVSIANFIINSLKENIALNILPSRENEYSYEIDNTKISKVLDFIPKFTIESAAIEIYEKKKDGLWS